ncbi:MAG: thiamine phosphate synthase [Acidobacteriota bacterium]|nr:thiamine phosphate synthase [Acidobacteriota bacterium]
MKRYYITDRKPVGGFRSLLEIIRDQMHLGVDLIQIREKDLSARELFEFTLAVLEVRNHEIKRRLATKILVNSRSDVAIVTGADGVHLPSNAPEQVLPGLLVGRSCHTLDEVKRTTADFVTFGPVYESPGKGPAAGLKALEQACKLGKPVYGLGGVNWDNADECMRAGAEGIAGIRLFQEPELRKVSSSVASSKYLSKRLLVSIFVFACWPALAFGQEAPTHPDSVQNPIRQPGQLAPKAAYKPLTTEQKFRVRAVQVYGIRGLLGTAFGSAIGQATNTPSEWGQGAQGYFTRYASGFGNNLFRQTFAFGLETALHEDPRYFPSESRTAKARLVSILKQAVLTRKDDGSSGFAYGRYISAFGAGQFTNLWQPKSNSGFLNGFERGLIILSGDVAINAINEFIPITRLKFLGHRH